MCKLLRIGSTVLLLVSILFTFPVLQVTKAVNEFPKSLRVGLYYKDPYVNTSVASFNVSSANGVSIGTQLSGRFFELVKHSEASSLIVRKDTYFIKAPFKEYNPMTLPLPYGEKIGPYHIKIGNDYTDMASASAAADLLKQSNLATYLAFADAWQVWTGFFIDAVTAQSFIDQKLKPVIADGICTIIEPELTSTVISKDDGSTFLLYSSSVSPLEIMPCIENKIDVLKLDKNQYRGRLEVRRLQGSDMTVLNIVDICDYLNGSVPAEIGGKSPLEALKAQAVVAKMFAFNSKGKHLKQGFDVCNSVHCQVYKGYNVETSQVVKAVEEVKDRIITFNGKPAKAIFYFSSSGGFTESNEYVWGTPYPYLISVEDKYEGAKTVNWKKVINASYIKKQMPDLGDILGISILTKSPTGRVTTLTINGTNKQNKYTKDRCRTVFGLSSQLYHIATDADISILASSGNKSTIQIGVRNIITSSGVKTIKPRSNKIAVLGAGGVLKIIPAIPEVYTFTGKGSGHAVGMSQIGAIGMANAGFTYDQIIMHYFQSTLMQ